MRVLLLALLLLPLAACHEDGPREEAPRSVPWHIDGQLRFFRADGTPITEIAIEVADTDSLRMRGLMDRDSFPANTGMLFIFPRAEPQAFYMANTPRSLDILFFGADSTLLNAATYTEPLSLENVTSMGPAQYVVEMPAGFVDRFGLIPGDRIRWTRTDEAPPLDTTAASTAAP